MVLGLEGLFYVSKYLEASLSHFSESDMLQMLMFCRNAADMSRDARFKPRPATCIRQVPSLASNFKVCSIFGSACNDQPNWRNRADQMQNDSVGASILLDSTPVSYRRFAGLHARYHSHQIQRLTINDHPLLTRMSRKLFQNPKS